MNFYASPDWLELFNQHGFPVKKKKKKRLVKPGGQNSMQNTGFQQGWQSTE